MSSQSLTPRESTSVDEEKQGVNHVVHEPSKAVEGVEPSPEISSDPEKGAEGGVKPPHAVEDDHEYITGIKLVLVMVGVTLACFLMLLDTSIITTVCPHSLVIECPVFAYHPTRPSLELPVTSTPSQMWAGMAAHTSLQSTDIPSQVSYRTDKLQLRDPAFDRKGLQQFQLQGNPVQMLLLVFNLMPLGRLPLLPRDLRNRICDMWCSEIVHYAHHRAYHCWDGRIWPCEWRSYDH